MEYLANISFPKNFNKTGAKKIAPTRLNININTKSNPMSCWNFKSEKYQQKTATDGKPKGLTTFPKVLNKGFLAAIAAPAVVPANNFSVLVKPSSSTRFICAGDPCGICNVAVPASAAFASDGDVKKLIAVPPARIGIANFPPPFTEGILDLIKLYPSFIFPSLNKLITLAKLGWTLSAILNSEGLIVSAALLKYCLKESSNFCGFINPFRLVSLTLFPLIE